MNEVKIAAELRELDRVRDFLNKTLDGAGISEEDFFMIELSLHEVCVNIVRYAYPDVKGDIIIRIWREEGKVYFEIRDTGIAFDPRQAEFPDIRESLRTGKTGGFGIYLVRVLMDGLVYRREAGQNILTMFKRISGTTPISV